VAGGPRRLPAWQNLNYGHLSHLSDDVKRPPQPIPGDLGSFSGRTEMPVTLASMKTAG
jgi:hypothetical protein